MVFKCARQGSLIGERPEGIIDATGFESRHVSRYYVWRRGQKRHARLHWPKLTLVCHRQSHLLPGAFVSLGPSQDSPQFAPAMVQAAQHVHFDRLLADAGYDAEHNHVLCRQTLGIRQTVIPARKRNSRRWPAAKYRRQMKRRFFHRVYGQRWQVESAISRHKRRLGSAWRSRRWAAQKAECLLRVLTHNLMILRFLGLRFSTEQNYFKMKLTARTPGSPGIEISKICFSWRPWRPWRPGGSESYSFVNRFLRKRSHGAY